MLSDKCIKFFSAYIVTSLLARHLGPDNFGQLMYLIAFVDMFNAFSNLGLDSVLIRIFCDKRRSSKIYLASSVQLRFFASIISTIFCIAISIIFIDADQIGLVLVLCLSYVAQTMDVFDVFNQSQSNSKKSILSKLPVYLIFSLIKLILIERGSSIAAFAITIGIEFLFVAFSMYITTASKLKINYKTVNLNVIKYLFLNGAPFMVSGFLITVYMRFDLLLIKYIIGDESLGVFSAVTPLGSVFNFLPSILLISLMPKLLHARDKSCDIFDIELYNLFRLFALLGWVVIVLTISSSGLIVKNLLGSKYIDGIVVLQIFSLTNLFIFLGMAQNVWFVSEKKGVTAIFNSMVGAVVSILSLLSLIGTFGIIGAAAAAVITQFSTSVLANYFHSKKIFYMQIRSLFMLPYRRIS